MHACSFHYILLEIKLEQGLVTVLDSRRKDPQDYADMTQMLEKYVKSIIIHHISKFVDFLISINSFLLSGRVWRKFSTKSPGLPKKLQFRHPKVSTIVACSAHLLVIQALVSSIPFSILAYQFDWPLFLVKCLWQEAGNDLCGYYICESIRHTTCERGYSDKQYKVRK